MIVLFILFQTEDPELLIRNQSSMHSNTNITEYKNQLENRSHPDHKLQIPEFLFLSSLLAAAYHTTTRSRTHSFPF